MAGASMFQLNFFFSKIEIRFEKGGIKTIKRCGSAFCIPYKIITFF